MLKSFAGGSLFGATWGPDRPSVLALHGWRRSHLDFSGVFSALDDPSAPSDTGAPPHTALPQITPPSGALAVDMAGFGATPAPSEPWGSDDYARSLLPLFDEPGALADRVVVVGHSFGGRVAVHLVGMVPDRIERMVLTGVPLLPRAGRRPRPSARFRLARGLHRAGLVSDDRMEALRHRYGSADYRAADGVIRAVFVGLLAERYDHLLPAIAVPVDLVWGEEDTEVPLEVAERAKPLFTSASLLTLPGVGHLVPTEAPAALFGVVRGDAVLPGQSADGADGADGAQGAERADRADRAKPDERPPGVAS